MPTTEHEVYYDDRFIDLPKDKDGKPTGSMVRELTCEKCGRSYAQHKVYFLDWEVINTASFIFFKAICLEKNKYDTPDSNCANEMEDFITVGQWNALVHNETWEV